MKGKEHTNGENLVDGDDRIPVTPPEIGPADYANVIDFNEDSDEEFEFIDFEEYMEESSSDEMEPLQIVPYQAVQFLMDAAEEQQIVEQPDVVSGDEDAAQEPAVQPQDGNLLEVMDDHVTDEDSQPAVVEANTDENQQPVEVAGIENEPEDAELDDQKLVESQVMELAGELVGKVEEQESDPAGSQLNKERNPAQHANAPHSFVENQDQEMNGDPSASSQDQEMNGDPSASSQDQEMNGDPFASSQDQEMNGDPFASSHDQEMNGGPFVLGYDHQELNENSSASGQDQELNGGSSNTRRDQEYENNGGRSGSSEDSIEEPVKRGECRRCQLYFQELAERDIQVPPIRGVEVQENAADQLVEGIRDVGVGEEIDHEELNGVPCSGELPEDQQQKVEIPDEEAVLVPDPVQVVQDIEAGINAGFVQDEHDNLVEEIVQEEQVVEVHEPAGGMEAGNNVISDGELVEATLVRDNVDIEEDGNVGAPFDPFIHMA